MSVVLQKINHPLLSRNDVELIVKRDDQLHQVISGNKAYKLKYNISDAQSSGASTLITFGGAFSNHLHATAFAAQLHGLKSVGVVRGEQILPLNPTLKDCVKWGMTLNPVSRSTYNAKNSDLFRQTLEHFYGRSFWVPEGGANLLGVKGAADILMDVDQTQFDYVVLACGTGTTLAGIISAAEPHIHVMGVPVLKSAEWMFDDVQAWLDMMPSGKVLKSWDLLLEYHFGGYAKRNRELDLFIAEMAELDLPLDFVYTAKALYALFDQVQKGGIPVGSRVLFCHTGGLQGMRS